MCIRDSEGPPKRHPREVSKSIAKSVHRNFKISAILYGNNGVFGEMGPQNRGINGVPKITIFSKKKRNRTKPPMGPKQ